MLPLYFGASANQIFSEEDDVMVPDTALSPAAQLELDSQGEMMCKRDQKPPRLSRL